jgi:hypothetical protein
MKVSAFSNANDWCVYRHIRLDKNLPFYIGIGKRFGHDKPKSRTNYSVIYHRAFESDPSKRNKIWKSITAKSGWRAEIVMDDLCKEEVSNKEQEFIRTYGRIDNGTGILANMTDGGDGIWNCKRSEEFKERCRILKTGEGNPNYGKNGLRA